MPGSQPHLFLCLFIYFSLSGLLLYLSTSNRTAFLLLFFWLCGLVVSMYLFFTFLSLSSSVVERIGIPWGERIDGLWVSAWGCTDSDLMDTAVHNVVYREAMSTAGTSAQYSASPHATQNQCCYPTLTFHPSQLAINSVIRPKLPAAECLEVQARIDCLWFASNGRVQS